MKILCDCDGPLFAMYRLWHEQLRHKCKDAPFYYGDSVTYDDWWRQMHPRFSELCIGPQWIEDAPWVEFSIETMRAILSMKDVEVIFVSNVKKDEALRQPRRRRLRKAFGNDITIDFDTPRWEISADLLIDDCLDNVFRFLADKDAKKTAFVWCEPWNHFVQQSNRCILVWNWSDIYQRIVDRLSEKETLFNGWSDILPHLIELNPGENWQGEVLERDDVI